MTQLSIFDLIEPPQTGIKAIKSQSNVYEVGKDNVAKIELTVHGSETTTIYKLSDIDGNIILFVGLLEHEVEWFE